MAVVTTDSAGAFLKQLFEIGGAISLETVATSAVELSALVDRENNPEMPTAAFPADFEPFARLATAMYFNPVMLAGVILDAAKKLREYCQEQQIQLPVVDLPGPRPASLIQEEFYGDVLIAHGNELPIYLEQYPLCVQAACDPAMLEAECIKDCHVYGPMVNVA